MSDQPTDARAPDPGQVVARETTTTDEPQASARNVRSTAWLAPGETPARQESSGGTPDCSAEQMVEREWFSRREDNPPVHELIASQARSVEEAMARLGPGASAEAVHRELDGRGLHVSLDDVRRVMAGFVPHPAAPADLVRTEGEPVPPPRAGRGGPTP
jgi:hypothetical protein